MILTPFDYQDFYIIGAIPLKLSYLEVTGLLVIFSKNWL